MAAEIDLADVARFYSENYPAGHDRFVAASLGLVDLLSRFPRAGREREDVRPGLRSFVDHPYVVFYRVDDRELEVSISRIRHGRLDLQWSDSGE